MLFEDKHSPTGFLGTDFDSKIISMQNLYFTIHLIIYSQCTAGLPADMTIVIPSLLFFNPQITHNSSSYLLNLRPYKSG